MPKLYFGIAVLVLLGLFGYTQIAKAAAPPRIVINEIMYNPASGVDSDEFLELYNTTASPVDLNGWCFTSGITACFGSVQIAAHGYVVVSPNISATSTTYGATASATYTGKLDNGGEKVTLKDNQSVTVSTLDYDDVTPWAATPDGTGPSLELRDPTLDEALAASWGASRSGATPGVQNSLVNSSAAVISNVSKPTNVAAGQSKVVTATIANAASAKLTYKVMFAADQEVTMYDDGAHGDGAASDGVYGATIPGQTAGDLVRYNISATNIEGTETAPGTDETIDYYGYVINDPAQTSTTPMLKWFIDDDDYTDLMNTGQDDIAEQYSCIVVYGDQVFDSSLVRLKGEFSRGDQFIKKSLKIDLPTGYQVDLPGISPYPLKQFHLNADFPQNNYIVSLVGWDVFAYAGAADHPRAKVQLMRNGDFEGAYTLIEKFDKAWLENNTAQSGKKYNTGIMYEDYTDKITGDNNDDSLRNSMRSALSAPDSPERREYMYDNVEIPSIINTMAVQAVLRSHDWSMTSNMMTYLDSAGSGRWSVLPWDLDLILNNYYYDTVAPEWAGGTYEIDPYETTDYFNVEDRFMFTAVWDDPTLRDMYKRRIRSLLDEVVASGKFDEYVEQQFAAAEDALNLDYQKYYSYELNNGFYSSLINAIPYFGVSNGPEAVQIVMTHFLGSDWADEPWSDEFYAEVKPFTPYDRKVFLKAQVKEQLAEQLGKFVDDGYIAATSQSATAAVLINEVSSNPAANADAEYIELYNPNSTPVDISQWQVSGVDVTLPGGAVLPANGYGLIIKNDTAFKAVYGNGKYVLGQYGGRLADEGETLQLLRKDTSVASSARYAPSSDGRSQELISATSNGSQQSCWAPSSSLGTPGSVNVPNAQWVASYGSVCANLPTASAATSSTKTTTANSTLAEADSSEERVDDQSTASILNATTVPRVASDANDFTTNSAPWYRPLIAIVAGSAFVAALWMWWRRRNLLQ